MYEMNYDKLPLDTINDRQKALDILALLAETPDLEMRQKILVAVIKKERAGCSLSAMNAILARGNGG